MTAAQQRVYRFVAEFIRENGYAPTRKEIADGLKFASPNSAECHLQALAKLGAIHLKPGGARRLSINTAYQGAV